MSGRGQARPGSRDGGRGAPGHPFGNQKAHEKSGNNSSQGSRVTSPDNNDSGQPSTGNRSSTKFVHNNRRGAHVGQNTKPGFSNTNSRPFTMSKPDNRANESKPQSPVAETHFDTKSGKFDCTEIKEANQSVSGSSGNGEKNMNSKDSSFIKEVEDDLFAAEDNVSLVHCVGADFRMGSGIAVAFREKFGRVGQLLDQRVNPGGVAFIKHDKKYVFYLVTKQSSTDKPTNETMRKCLHSLHDQCKRLKITKLAMPEIGCGLDRLVWEDVKTMLIEIFADGFDITVYNLKMDHVPKSNRALKQRVSNHKMFLKDIQAETGLLHITCGRVSVNDEMKSLDEKHPFIYRLERLKKLPLQLGTAFRTVDKTTNDNIYSLICKESADSPLSYEHLEIAINNLRRQGYDYFGIQAFEEKDDPHVMEKIDTLLRNSSVNAEFWICWPPSLEHKCPSEKQAQENMEVEENQQNLPNAHQQSVLPDSNLSEKSTRLKNSDNRDKTVTTEVEKQMTEQSISGDVADSWEVFENEPLPEVVKTEAQNTSEADLSMGDQSAEVDNSWSNSGSETKPDDATNPEDYAEAERRKSKDKKEASKLMKQEEKQDRRSAGSPKSCVTEYPGDLFEVDESISLAHCVGADFRMGSGIAVLFRQKFGSVPDLLQQRVSQGGVAVIPHGKRHIFYLVTKKESTGKPTYGTLERSLIALHDKCNEMNIKELAMPRIGCGLDRLLWNEVRPMIEHIFSDDFSIRVYNLEKDYQETPKSRPSTTIKPVELYLKSIPRSTALLCIGSEDMSITDEMKSLDEVYRFQMRLDKGRKDFGTVVRIEAHPQEIVYILICRKTAKDLLDYRAMDRAIRQLKKLIKKDEYCYMGIQAFVDEREPDVMGKVETMFRYSYIPVELWICYPPELKHLMSQSSSPMSDPWSGNGNGNGSGKKFWRDTQSNNHQSPEMFKEMQRTLDSMNKKLNEMDDKLKKAIDLGESKTEQLINKTSSEISELREVVVNFSTKLDNCFENFERRLNAQEIEIQSQKETIENMEQRLSKQEIGMRPSNLSYGPFHSRGSYKNNGGHPRPAYSEAPPPLVPNLAPAQLYPAVNMYCRGGMPVFSTVDNEPHEHCGYPSPGEYLHPNNSMFATETLRPEIDALLRATKQKALPHGYKVMEHNGCVYVKKDHRSDPHAINSYNDLNNFNFDDQ